ncbi:kinase-like domain-containing protein [Zopfochytrium polystomum]|nr:kinase-like domain-containing protein [Zopfochytrium polystomum]
MIGTPYAIKSLRKHQIVATKQTRHVLHEKTLLQQLGSADPVCPFIVNLVATFQDPRHLYMVMEFVSGGDLWSHIRRYGRFLEEEAKFYAAEIVLGVEFIHSKGIIFRDLKPENILVTATGHLKITDFGFAKPHPSPLTQAATFCGTPAYMAPEIILREPYTLTADWWSVGIVTYELMAGYTPFYADTPLRIYERVIDESAGNDGGGGGEGGGAGSSMRWSSQIKGDAKALVAGLLARNPARRLGAWTPKNAAFGVAGGARDVRGHPWFADVEWARMEAGAGTPPFVPDLRGEDDLAYFDVYPEESSVIKLQAGRLKPDKTDGTHDDQFRDF